MSSGGLDAFAAADDHRDAVVFDFFPDDALHVGIVLRERDDGADMGRIDAETGAVGIPNLGGENGAQLLAITFEDDEHVNIRWQGNVLTPYDLELMTTAEQERLTTQQLNQIELSRQRQLEQEEKEK